MGAARCTASLLVGTASTLFLAIGLAIIAANIATLVTFIKELVPSVVSFSGIGVGLAVVFVAAAGYRVICSKAHRRCWLFAFMAFDLVLFILFGALAFYVLRSDDALTVLNKSGFVNVTDSLEHSVATVLREGVHRTYDACQAEVDLTNATAEGRFYEMSCNRTEWDMVADIVNSNCIGSSHAVLRFTPTNATEFKSCFVDQSFWTSEQNGYSQPVTWSNIDLMMETPKGVFCQCYGTPPHKPPACVEPDLTLDDEWYKRVAVVAGTLSDIFSDYFGIIKWSSLGIALFFGIVFAACCYLCCCDKREETKSLSHGSYNNNYVARP